MSDCGHGYPDYHRRHCVHCTYGDEIAELEAEIERLRGSRDHFERSAFNCVAEIERLRAALERMDDRKNPMLPRSEMARIAKEALDYAT